jgi:glycerol uptake facilitator-like aquaporin
LVSNHTTHLWVYLVAPTLGAVLAAPVWKFLYVEDK